MRGVPHSKETKAAALAALLTGQSVDKVAAEYHLPRQTVQEWNRQAKAVAEVVQTEKPDDGPSIGDLLARYLKRNLATLEIQAGFFADTEWLREQDAADAAVLHGVLTDKSIRLLEALDPGGDTDMGAEE